MKEYTKYEHHGAMVSVRKDLAGTHRSHCLCYECARFMPSTGKSCHIAKTVFETCVRFSIVTPVWECPVFTTNIDNKEQIQ